MVNFLLHIFQGILTLFPGKMINHLRRSLFKQKSLYQKRQKHTDNTAEQYAEAQFHMNPPSATELYLLISYHKIPAFPLDYFEISIGLF